MTRSEVQVPHRPPVQGMLFCLIEITLRAMVLSGSAIKVGVHEGRIGISPYEEGQIEAAHVNLHLGECDAMTDDTLLVKAGGFVLAKTLERITLPYELCGSLEGRSKLAQQGLSIEQSSTFIEPGSDSVMTLEIFNASAVDIQLRLGQKVAKMVLIKITDDF